jgi:tetratricopeptide (TPR) repeat protein
VSLNFFKAFGSSRRLKNALDHYAANPGVEETLLVVDIHFKAKNYAKAFQYANNGYQRFPSSNELLQRRQESLKKKAHADCKVLQKRISRNPRPEAIAKVIEIRRSLGDFTRCEKLSVRWGDEFPRSWVLQFSIGKYLFQKSLIDKDASNSSRCLEQLELAAALKPGDYKTLLYLATLNYQLGALTPAVEALEKLLRLFPSEPHAVALLRHMREAFPDEVISSSVDESTDEKRSEIAEAVFDRVTNFDSVRAALVVQGEPDDPDVELDYTSPKLPQNTDASDNLRGLIHSLQVSSARMGIGNLLNCVLDGEKWNIYFCRIGRVTLLIYSTKQFTEGDFIGVMKMLKPEKIVA